jgi:hypothetical protein
LGCRLGMRFRDLFLDLFKVGKGNELHLPMVPQSA